MINHFLCTQLGRGRTAIARLLHQRVNQEIGLVLAGHGLRLLLGLISSAILARALGPEGLRVFALIGTLRTIAGTVADFGLQRSAIRHIVGNLAGEPALAFQTTAAYSRFKLMSALLMTGVLFAFAGPIAQLLKLSEPLGVILGAVLLLTTALTAIVSTLLQALRRFGALIIVQSANIGLTVIFTAVLWQLGSLTVFWAIGVGSITAVASALIGYYLLTPDWRQALQQKPRADKTAQRQLLSFSKWLWISALMTILTVQLDLLLVNYWLAPVLVGIYALARNLIAKVDILTQTLHIVLLPNVSALDSPQAYRLFIRQTLKRGLLLAALILPLLPLARPFILFVYGPAFSDAVNIFYALMIVALFDLVISPLFLLVLPLNVPHLMALADGVQIILLIVFSQLFIPHWGPYGIIAAKFLARLLGGGVLALLIKRRLLPGVGER